MRKAVFLLVVIAMSAGTGWYLGKHDVGGKIDIGDLQDLFGTSSQQTSSVLPINRTTDSIRIASFNIQVLGTTKSQKAHVMEILARIVRQYDVVAIQEIRSQDQSVIPQFVDLINSAGRHYDYAVGPRLGRSSSQEQYAFIFDTASIELDRNQLYTIDDPDDLLHREPYVGWFRVRGPNPEDAFTFSLVNIHVDPDEAADEVDVLDDVYRVVRDDGRGEDDVIILGDLNVDYRHMGELSRVPGLSWVNSGIPTNTLKTAQYDNILFQEHATREFTGRGGVFDFMIEYGLTAEGALEVSDHLPVWGEFSIYEGGTPGHVARR